MEGYSETGLGQTSVPAIFPIIPERLQGCVKCVFLYIESVANYLSIWYFQDGALKQKRIRNTLKNIEELLAGYTYILHCHRAFLVNTRYITHVDGNSAGCQLHLFSIDRTIPVSKANIASLQQALRINSGKC